MSLVEDIQILKGVVSKDHVHLHIEYRIRLQPKLKSQTVQRYAGKYSRYMR
uniref:transposase n=1 Tax=Myroides odoratimimus TaxID=76832 RepID=UPI0012F50B43